MLYMGLTATPAPEESQREGEKGESAQKRKNIREDSRPYEYLNSTSYEENKATLNQSVGVILI